MSKILMGTNYLSLDEYALSLTEEVAPAPDYRSLHYWQEIKVLRGGKITVMRRDLGPAKNFKSKWFKILGCGPDLVPVERVGDLLDIADHIRNEKQRTPERSAQDLLAGYYYKKEQERKLKKHGANYSVSYPDGIKNN